MRADVLQAAAARWSDTRVSAEALKSADSDAAQTGGTGTAEGFAFT